MTTVRTEAAHENRVGLLLMTWRMEISSLKHNKSREDRGSLRGYPNPLEVSIK